MRKKYSSYVYVCPICWRTLTFGEKPKWPVKCCMISHNPEHLIIFDSITEADKGLELKIMEKSGIIQDLRHHEKFGLLPALYLTGNISCTGNGIYIISRKDKHFFLHTKQKNIISNTPYDGISYESDFSFTRDGKKRVIEVKDLGKKLITKSIKQSQGSIKIKAGSTPWPFFTKTSSLVKFKKKCQLMKAIYGIDVEIWAGPRVFRFNEKWKLMEAVK